MRTPTIALGLAAAALSLAACTSSTTSSASSDATQAADDAIAKAEQAAGIPPRPTGQALDTYLADLKAIDPALVAKPERAVDNGRNTCGTIKLKGEDKDTTDLAAMRFSTGTHPVGPAAAARIVKVVHKDLCPKN